MKKLIAPVLLALTITVVANAGAIKTWASETLRYADLNSNFTHIHNTMVGGHGARLVDADVSTTAAIAHTKVATPALLPKAWAQVATCAAGTCTMSSSSQIASVVFVSTGVYTITWTTARSDANYSVMITVPLSTGARCHSGTLTTTTAQINCYDSASALVNTATNILMFDNT